MTLKERIEAFVKQQGNQVGAGAELAAILNDILDAIPAAQVQSDYAQADNTKPDYIKNKPTIPAPYTLPPASAETLGGIKVGENLSINEGGVLSASGGGALIIEGTTDDSNFFTPNEGQPSHVDAVEAYTNGTIVLLDIMDNVAEVHTLCTVSRYNLDSDELTAGSYFW
jgi:hypothetical protein